MADLREILRPGRDLEIKHPDTGSPVRWTVQGLLQESARGFVFEVQDPEGRPAILKGPSRAPGAAYAAIIEREILKKVSPHAHLVKYLGAKDEVGMPLVVLGWTHENPWLRLNGPARETLSRWSEAGAGVGLPATTAVELVFEVVLGLEHLHSKGFVHTDVKPANVVLEVEPLARELADEAYFRAVAEGRGRAVLADVGGARSESFLEDLNAGNVDPSIVPPELTPLYAPPEAIVGAETREGRRPIYSAGIDLYQVGVLLGIFLTGRSPYEHLGDRYDRSNLQHILEMKLAERRGEVAPFPPGAIRAARHEDVGGGEGGARPWRPAFDEAAESILTRCLARDAKERGTIVQLRASMERAFDLAPNPQASEGVGPAFRLKQGSLLPENRFLAAAAAAGPPEAPEKPRIPPPPATPVPLPPNAAQQVLRMAAQLAGGTAPPAPATPAAPVPETKKLGAVVRPTSRPGMRSLQTPVPPPAAPASPPTATPPPPTPAPAVAPAPTAASSPATTPPVPSSGPDLASDRVVVRVASKDIGKAFEVISKEGARALEVEGNKFDFRISPARACEVVRRLIELGVDVFFFERRKVGATQVIRPGAAGPAAAGPSSAGPSSAGASGAPSTPGAPAPRPTSPPAR